MNSSHTDEKNLRMANPPTDNPRSFHDPRSRAAARSLSEQAGDELETFFAELQSKVDDLRSMNRKLRATIERLESSKNQAISRAETLQNINYGLELKLGRHPARADAADDSTDGFEIPVMVVDDSGRIVRFSSELTRVLELGEDDLGRRIDEIDLGPGTAELVESVRCVMDGDEPTTLELQIRDDRWFVVFVFAPEIRDVDATEIFVEFVEITVRRNIESRLRRAHSYAETIFDAFHHPLVILDSDMVIRDANVAFLAAFDYEREKIIDRCILQIDAGRWDHATLRELLRSVVSNDIVLADFEFTYKTSLPPARHFMLEANRLDDRDMILLGMKEVTEQRRTHEQLVSREAELKALNLTLEKRVKEQTSQVRSLMRALTLAEQEERRRLSLVLHDDLQQRLYGLEMVLGLVCETSEQDESARLLEQAGDILREAIDQARTLSSELSPPMVKLTDVEETFQWLKLRKKELHDLDVEIDVRDEPTIPNRALLDLIYQIVRELLFNVVKHAGVDRARLSAWQDGEEVMIRVEDEGTGFDTSVLDLDRDFAGSFGLSSIRYRLEIVGGRLLIKSKPGSGTSITLVVPVRDDDSR